MSNDEPSLAAVAAASPSNPARRRSTLPRPIEAAAERAISEAEASGGHWTDEGRVRLGARYGYEAGREDEAKLQGDRVDAWFRNEIEKHPRCDYAAWLSYLRPKIAELLK